MSSPEQQKQRGGERVDPTTFSSLPPERITPISAPHFEYGTYIMKDEQGNRWYELAKEPYTQYVVSKMLKGIVPVVDVTIKEVDGRIYVLAKDMELEYMQEAVSNSDIEAYAALLECIFGDHDHRLLRGNIPFRTIPHNVIRKGGAAVFYDFEWAFEFFRSFTPSFDGKQRLTPFGRIDDLPKKSLAFLKKKLEELRERFDGESGERFVQAIVTRVGMPLFDKKNYTPSNPHGIFAPPTDAKETDDSSAYFLQVLRQRIHNALRRVEERLEKK